MSISKKLDNKNKKSQYNYRVSPNMIRITSGKNTRTNVLDTVPRDIEKSLLGRRVKFDNSQPERFYKDDHLKARLDKIINKQESEQLKNIQQMQIDESVIDLFMDYNKTAQFCPNDLNEFLSAVKMHTAPNSSANF